MRSIYAAWVVAWTLVGCQGAGDAPPDATSYSVVADVEGLAYPPSDSLRTSNGLVLQLNTSRGQQTLAVAGRDGTYAFAQAYDQSVFFDLQIREQPDEYFCQRTDATANTTAETTHLPVSCDYLGPEFFRLQWLGDELQLLGGSLDLRYDNLPVESYGLWSRLVVLEDAYVQLVMAHQSPAPEDGEEPRVGELVLTLPSLSTAGEQLQLQPYAFAAGTAVPAGQATLSYQTDAERAAYAAGTVTVVGFGMRVSSRWRGQGAAALEFEVDATVDSGTAVARLTGGLLLSASSDATVAVGSFGVDDGELCVYDPGQTVAIDPRGLTCHDAVAEGTYYRPIYTVARGCIEQVADTGGQSFRCIRTADPRCTAPRDYPRCE